MTAILTLCVGNICRSPLAQVLLARELPEQTVWSAGLSALVGHPADPLSVAVAADHGLDISGHRAQQLVGWMAEQASLILVMEQSHRLDVLARFPWVRGKLYRLGEFGQFDVADPYRQPRTAFDRAFERIAQGVADWVPRIKLL